MAAPFELYISWTAFYPIPAVRDGCTRLPTVTDLVWSKLTPSEILKNNLELSRGIDKDVSEIAIRTVLNGDFTIFGANYDLLTTAIAANFNELILRVDRWNGATYDEYWRGTVEIRGSQDANRKKATLSKFSTIDDYTDFLRYRKTNRVSNRPNGSGADVKMEVKNGVPVTIQQSILGQFNFILNFHPSNLSQYSRSIVGWPEVNYKSDLFPTDYKLLGLADDGINGKELYCGTVGMAVDFTGNTDAEISLSYQKIFDVYLKLFDAPWLIGQPFDLEECFDNNHIFLRRKRDTFNNNVVHSFISESEDFQKLKHISPKLITTELHEFSNSNADLSHVNAEYVYNVNGDLEEKVSESVVFTDAQRLYDANIQSKEDDWLNDSDWFFGIANQPVNGVPAWIFKEGTTQLGATTNFDISLAYRMANDINDFQQLDDAFYNNLDRSLNPNFAMPAIEQVPFPINTTDISSLDFYGITQTSLGNMRIIKATVGFNDIKSMVKCVQ